MRSVPGATPLASLDAVVFATETTGLDTAKARIIEIGGIKIDAGRLDDATFCELVDPGQPLSPPSRSSIAGASWSAIRSASTSPSSVAKPNGPA